MNLPQRKGNRLENFNYNEVGAYFLTLCVKDRKQILSNIVGATTGRPQIKLTEIGRIVEIAIRNVEKYYPSVSVDSFIIMPDHIHLLLQIHTDENGRPMVAPTIDRIVKQFKGYVSKKIGFSLWQKSYYDHVIRCEQDYREACEYIENNPIKWIMQTKPKAIKLPWVYILFAKLIKDVHFGHGKGKGHYGIIAREGCIGV